MPSDDTTLLHELMAKQNKAAGDGQDNEYTATIVDPAILETFLTERAEGILVVTTDAARVIGPVPVEVVLIAAMEDAFVLGAKFQAERDAER